VQTINNEQYAIVVVVDKDSVILCAKSLVNGKKVE
jgi:hypothetical protein